MHYRIRIQGHLDQTFQDRFLGLRIQQQEAGTTLLVGTLPDQSARNAGTLTVHPARSSAALA